MDSSPGVDLIMPDVSWLELHADRLEGRSSSPSVRRRGSRRRAGSPWPRLRAPVYARPFTAAIARMKMEDAGVPTDVLRVVTPRPDVVEVGRPACSMCRSAIRSPKVLR